MAEILLCGDPHGNFSAIHAAVTDSPPDAAILLGDLDLVAPLESTLAPVVAAGVPIYWIYGNHDAQAAGWWANLWRSPLAAHCLHGRVVTVAGLRVAGLGGIFERGLWRPGKETPQPPAHARADVRAPLHRRARAALWPEDLDTLAGQRADLLVTHDAPTTDYRGYTLLDDLASGLGVALHAHGHHHTTYRGITPAGVQVQGVGNGEVVRVHLKPSAAAPLEGALEAG